MTKTKDISHQTQGSQRTTCYVFENPAGSAALRENIFSSPSPAFVLNTRETMKTISHTETQGSQRRTFYVFENPAGSARVMKDA
jgi:hypothetical protein